MAFPISHLFRSSLKPIDKIDGITLSIDATLICGLAAVTALILSGVLHFGVPSLGTIGNAALFGGPGAALILANIITIAIRAARKKPIAHDEVSRVVIEPPHIPKPISPNDFISSLIESTKKKIEESPLDNIFQNFHEFCAKLKEYYEQSPPPSQTWPAFLTQAWIQLAPEEVLLRYVRTYTTAQITKTKTALEQNRASAIPLIEEFLKALKLCFLEFVWQYANKNCPDFDAPALAEFTETPWNTLDPQKYLGLRTLEESLRIEKQAIRSADESFEQIQERITRITALLEKIKALNEQIEAFNQQHPLPPYDASQQTPPWHPQLTKFDDRTIREYDAWLNELNSLMNHWQSLLDLKNGQKATPHDIAVTLSTLALQLPQWQRAQNPYAPYENVHNKLIETYMALSHFDWSKLGASLSKERKTIDAMLMGIANKINTAPIKVILATDKVNPVAKESEPSPQTKASVLQSLMDLEPLKIEIKPQANTYDVNRVVDAFSDSLQVFFTDTKAALSKAEDFKEKQAIFAFFTTRVKEQHEYLSRAVAAHNSNSSEKASPLSPLELENTPLWLRWSAQYSPKSDGQESAIGKLRKRTVQNIDLMTIRAQPQAAVEKHFSFFVSELIKDCKESIRNSQKLEEIDEIKAFFKKQTEAKKSALKAQIVSYNTQKGVRPLSMPEAADLEKGWAVWISKLDALLMPWNLMLVLIGNQCKFEAVEEFVEYLNSIEHSLPQAATDEREHDDYLEYNMLQKLYTAYCDIAKGAFILPPVHKEHEKPINDALAAIAKKLNVDPIKMEREIAPAPAEDRALAERLQAEENNRLPSTDGDLDLALRLQLGEL